MRHKNKASNHSNFAASSRLRAWAGLVAVFICTIILPSGLAWGTYESTDIPIAPFKDSTLNDWTERSFSGNSKYEIVDLDGIRALKGSTAGAASILYKQETIDLTKTPIINWSWKVKGVYDDIDEQTREGDDFPARLYVVFQTGMLPWESVAINYVWSSNQAIGKSWPNPFTKDARMIVVQTGNSNAGKWITQSRNIAADFKELFDEDVEEIHGYAVMIDGDNANKRGTAWFAGISFEAE